MALINKLNAIGNAIREKTGTTDSIPLADMPNAIKNISGGGGTTGKQEKTGTFILDANATQPIITHNCGFVPSFFLAYPIDEIVSGNLMTLGCVVVNIVQFNDLNADKKTQFIWDNLASSTAWNNVPTLFGELTETTVKLPHRNVNYKWKAGFQYGWIAIE
jgi:hypothetical protein